MNPFDFLSEINRRNPPLFWFGWLNVLMLALALILFNVDDTIITGINAWIKPMKFAMSIAIYAWTFAWLLEYIQDIRKRNFIAWGIILCMAVENGLIFMQAARGVRSHFNVTSAFNGIVFSTMGMFILINTIIVMYTIILFFSKKVNLETPLLWAWRAGLVFFFLGAISGGIMSVIMTHTIGAEDGGPGLPFVNWSTIAGDIRSAHFITLHGLQAIPLATLLFIKVSKEKSTALSLSFAGFYFLICAWLHWLAFSGMPIIGLSTVTQTP